MFTYKIYKRGMNLAIEFSHNIHSFVDFKESGLLSFKCLRRGGKYYILDKFKRLGLIVNRVDLNRLIELTIAMQ